MTAIYAGDGKTITFTAAAAITKDDIVPFPADGDTAHLVGIAHATYASGATDAVISISGEYKVTKAAGTAWAIGDLIYLNNGTQTCSETATSNSFVGVASRVAASGDTTGYVLINVGGRET